MPPIQVLVFVVAAAACLLFGYLQRIRRTSLWTAAFFFACAAAAAQYDSFWSLVTCALFGVWALICASTIADLGWRMRLGVVLTIMGFAGVSLWPSLEKMTSGLVKCPAYVKDRVSFELVAGLDLQGGLRLVYAVDVDEAIRDRRDVRYEDMQLELAKLLGLHSGNDRPSEDVYKQLRARVEIETPKSETSVIRLNIKDVADAKKLDALFLNKFLGDLTYSKSEDGRIFSFHMKEAAESEIRQTSVNQAKEIILRRIDELGLREASVSTRDEDIIVEVPGENEARFKEIREIIGQTARLEFKMVDDDTDFFRDVASAPQAEQSNYPADIQFLPESAPVGLAANGKDRLTNQVTYAYLPLKKDETSKEGLDRFREWTDTLALPQDRELGYQLVYNTDDVTLKETEGGWRTILLKRRADITGDMIRDAQARPDQSTTAVGGWNVSLSFTDAGGTIFERITGANVQRRFAIILDDRVQSAPVILGRIAGGNAQITMGSDDPQQQLTDARKLELVLRAGALPAPLSPSNEQTIGPSLGANSIRLGVQGALVGACAVLVFMILYYRKAGLIADVAVVANLILQLAVLATFGASMTLPGIAALALNIGMSVDANVLINERIREELRDGKSPRAAVEVGYSRAFTAIIDGHFTTLISAIILAQYGTGPIKGFAVTLIAGVVTSIFTGVVVSRVMFDLWVRGLPRTAKLDVG